MGCCGSKEKRYIHYKYGHLCKPHSALKASYDVVVIGSGYGAAVAACRAARAGQSVCVLEKGKEWLPGDFPEAFPEVVSEMHIVKAEEKKLFGHPSGLFNFTVSGDLTVLSGCGVGGSSLINEAVAMDCKAKVYYDPVWPQQFREDIQQFKTSDRALAAQMLRPAPYPDDYPTMPRIEQLRNVAQNMRVVDIEDLNESFFRAPLCINFVDAPSNHIGMPQPACNGCGNCLSGCNTGAKNTLAMNYIPDAVARGAEIYAQMEVTAVMKDYETYKWQIFYRDLSGNSAGDECSIQAQFVIIGAGAIGSTKILLESKERGLDLSSRLGMGLNSNGGLFGVSCRGEASSNAVGYHTGMYKNKPKKRPATGPAVTSFLDTKMRRGGFIMLDVATPGAFKAQYLVSSAIGCGAIKMSSIPHGKQWNELLKGMDLAFERNTLGLFCIADTDESDGEISIDPTTKCARIVWDARKHEKYYFTAKKALEDAANTLKGSYSFAPKFSNELGTGLLTTHPLGGCCMGEMGHNGVVNHRGQLFIGDSEEVYDGFLVVGSATVPCALGVNPAFTVTGIAERCMRLLAQEEQWNIDYSFPTSRAPPHHGDTAM